MTLIECCKLIQDITRISITILESPTERAEFCSRYQFHPIQEYLLPHNIELLFRRSIFQRNHKCNRSISSQAFVFPSRLYSGGHWAILYGVLL